MPKIKEKNIQKIYINMSNQYESISAANREPCFDPNAFGMATLLGGLLLLGFSSDMMIQDDDHSAPPDNNNIQTDKRMARAIAYIGLILVFTGLLSFAYSCMQMLSKRDDGDDDAMRRSLLRHNSQNKRYFRKWCP